MAERARSGSIPAEASAIPAYACCCCCGCCCCRMAKICCSRALPATTSAPIICRFAAGCSSWGCCLAAAFLGAARLAAFGAGASPSPSPSVAGRLPFGGGVSVTFSFLAVAASAAAVVPMAGTGAFNQAARSSQCWRCILASRKARRQLPHVRMLNHFSCFFSFAEAYRTTAQPAPSFSEAPARMSSHTRRPFGMNSPRRTPGCSGSGC
mmetsp:Transcript_15494/g.38966  ORF Transcript_15494/g.38966 Transcript_15494/m.38966 type:complete len:209 (-) Transcript_15494:303-929(-)